MISLEEMYAIKLNEVRFGIRRVPGGWIYNGSVLTQSGVFVPEPFDQEQQRADYERSNMKMVEQAMQQLGERLKAHDDAIEKRILAYDEHLRSVIAGLGRTIPTEQKEPVQ